MHRHVTTMKALLTPHIPPLPWHALVWRSLMHTSQHTFLCAEWNIQTNGICTFVNCVQICIGHQSSLSTVECQFVDEISLLIGRYTRLSASYSTRQFSLNFQLNWCTRSRNGNALKPETVAFALLMLLCRVLFVFTFLNVSISKTIWIWMFCATILPTMATGYFTSFCFHCAFVCFASGSHKNRNLWHGVRNANGLARK